MFQLAEEDFEIIKNVLKTYPYRFYVFGSRAKNKARPLSDLDLCIKEEAPIPLSTLARIEADFEESDLPFKVDVKDWHRTSASFKALIEKDFVLFRR